MQFGKIDQYTNTQINQYTSPQFTGF